MYEIVKAEWDNEAHMRLIHVKEKISGRELLYYEDEVKHIPCPDLNFSLTWNMNLIRKGLFDKK